MRTRSKVGIKEVAAAAGVSVTTVSHALNDKGRLPEATRQRVREVAEQLGYRPNATARNLVVGRTGLLGMIVSQDGDEPPFAVSDFAYFTQLMMAASTAALDESYALVLAPSDAGPDLRDKVSVDGAIVIDPRREDPIVAALREAGTPLVTVGRLPGDYSGTCWVDNDHVAGTRAALDHLRAAGGQRVALLSSPLGISYTHDAERAYRGWCADHDVAPLVRTTPGGPTERAGRDATIALLELPQPPDAIFTTYDRLAHGALSAAESRGVGVPHELLLATTAAESRQADEVSPALTTLDLHPVEIGRAAAALLIELLGDDEPTRRHQLIPHRVVVRESSTR